MAYVNASQYDSLIQAQLASLPQYAALYGYSDMAEAPANFGPAPTTSQQYNMAYANVPQAEDLMNYRVIARHIPSLHSILHTAPYAVIYTFQQETSSWEKSGVEGSLFICRLQSAAPVSNTGMRSIGQTQNRYALVILNRRGLDNWMLELTNREGIQVTEEYIILGGQKSMKDAAVESQAGNIPVDGQDEEEEKVWGIWIFEESIGSTAGQRAECQKWIEDCAGMAEGLEEQNAHAQHPSMMPANNHQSPQPDLMAMLNGSTGTQTNVLPAGPQHQSNILMDLFRGK